MNEFCKHLRASSNYVLAWLTRQPSVKEESLTDWLLYDVSTRLPRVIYHPFTRHEEARETGADWEWWFVFRKGGVCFRVQAKKVSSSRDNYPELAHTNKYGLQIDMLLSSSTRADAIPLYALYSSAGTDVMCKGVKLSQHCDGVFMAGGHSINDAFIAGPRKKVTAVDLLRLSNPFSCFACCPYFGEGQSGLRGYLEMYYASELRARVEGERQFIGFHAELPGYVSSALEIGQSQLPDWWEGEFRAQVGDCKALLIYDLRDQEIRQDTGGETT